MERVRRCDRVGPDVDEPRDAVPRRGGDRAGHRLARLTRSIAGPLGSVGRAVSSRHRRGRRRPHTQRVERPTRSDELGELGQLVQRLHRTHAGDPVQQVAETEPRCSTGSSEQLTTHGQHAWRPAPSRRGSSRPRSPRAAEQHVRPTSRTIADDRRADGGQRPIGRRPRPRR